MEELSRCILANPARGGRSHWGETLKSVSARLKRWCDCDFMGLWADALMAQDRLSKPKKESPMSLRACRTRRAMEEGQYKKAMQALTSSGVAQASPEVLAEMKAKHPQDDSPTTPPDPVPLHVRPVASTFEVVRPGCGCGQS